MAYKPGHGGYKPKGSIHNKTKAWENLGEFITEAGAERVKEILATCPPDKFLMYYTMLLEYFKPKLARVDTLELDKDTAPLPIIEIIDTQIIDTDKPQIHTINIE
jgi:hypothetical protein